MALLPNELETQAEERRRAAEKRRMERRMRREGRSLQSLELVLAPSGILDADGNATAVELRTQFLHEPGQIVESRSGARYMVQPNHSLKRIV